VLIVLGSVTNALADFATRVIGDLGLPGVFVLMTATASCIPIPSEVTMLFTGFNVSEHEYTLLAALSVAVAAELVGSTIAYTVGYYGRTGVLEKHGKKLRLKPHHLEITDRWFARYGSAAVFFARMIPLVRSFISISAGIARMPYPRFIVLTFCGVLPWDLAGILAGKAARDNWTDIKDKLHYVDYGVVAAIVAGAIYLIVRRSRGSGGGPAPDAAV
jgi:membrane protein DedA with SNARE-associated domain